MVYYAYQIFNWLIIAYLQTFVNVVNHTIEMKHLLYSLPFIVIFNDVESCRSSTKEEGTESGTKIFCAKYVDIKGRFYLNTQNIYQMSAP